MQPPTYTLEKVVKSKNEELGDFEGPLDLILALLAKNKIEIRDIKISLILEQYMAHLAKMQERDLNVASEFVQMASYLVYLKTKELLEEKTEEELSEMELFMQMLEKRQNEEQFALVKKLLPEIEEGYAAASDSFIRPGEKLEKDRSYKFTHEASELMEAFLAIASAESAQKFAASSVANVVPKPVYPVEKKIDSIRARLIGKKKTSLRALFMESGSRSEVVALFLAVLELCRRGDLRVAGGSGDCTLTLREKDGEKADD